MFFLWLVFSVKKNEEARRDRWRKKERKIDRTIFISGIDSPFLHFQILIATDKTERKGKQMSKSTLKGVPVTVLWLPPPSCIYLSILKKNIACIGSFLLCCHLSLTDADAISFHDTAAQRIPWWAWSRHRQLLKTIAERVRAWVNKARRWRRRKTHRTSLSCTGWSW